MTVLARPRTLRLHPDDNVLTAIVALQPGDQLGEGETVATAAVPSAHKVAAVPIASGAPIRKFGHVIGIAMSDIAPGEHVHVHNVAADGSAPDTAIGADAAEPAPLTGVPTFAGYRRADGRAGTRNYVGVLTTVNCAATVARKIAERFTPERLAPFPAVDGVAAFTHTTGCGTAHDGEGVDNLQRTIAGFATHPNFAGVLLIGLGCEVNQMERLFESQGLTPGPTLRTLTIQETGGTLKAIARGDEIVSELIAHAATARREPIPASELVLGLQCGGSDAYSGVTANPSLGAAADLLVRAGGTVILGETPEIYGAEGLLLRRAASAEAAGALQARLAWWEEHAARHGVRLNNNPSPGNIEGGLTTILEKSLGATAKSGSTPLRAVYRYGERVRARGFVVMDSPGYDPCSVTGEIASGANLICFTTGRGSVFGAKPAPSLKLASNSALAGAMEDDIDLDCGSVLSGEVSIEEMGERIFERLVALASGEPSASERLGFGDLEFVPWQVGALL
ncbi:MAG: altronate dehydratase family protein [Caulobacterales bacterium]|nr:altronate dehydratase family protein [Caulobacterales bacterium]